MATPVEQPSVPSGAADAETAAGVFVPLTGRLVYPESDHVLRFLREGWFEHRELVLMSRLVRPGDAFVDIGAHCGLYSSLALRRLRGNGTLVAVEPNPALHSYIRRNVAIENFTSDGEIMPGVANLVSAAVATGAGTASLHVPDGGRSAYSSLNPDEESGRSEEVEVPTRSLESLVPATVREGAIFIKLDTEGLEHDILQSSSDFLRSRDDLHLLIEFDEHNQSVGSHATSELGGLIGSLGYELNEFDPATGLLEPFRGEYPLWGRNLLATRRRDALNERLRHLSPDVLIETQDFLERGEAASHLYRRSESLHTMVRAAEGFAKQIAATFAEITADPGSLDKAKTRRKAALKELDPDRPVAMIRLIEEEYGRITGSTHALVEDINRLRIDKAATSEKMKALADQIEALRADAATTATEMKARTDEIDALRAAASATAAEMKTLTGQAGILRSEVQVERSRRKSIEGRIVLLRNLVEEARGQIATLIAAIHAEQSGTGRRGGLFRFRDRSALLQKAFNDADAAKTALSSVASKIDRLAKEAAVGAFPEVRPGNDDGDRLTARVRDLDADIYRMGMLASELRQSRWLRMGDRFGAGVSNRLDAIVAIFEKWKQLRETDRQSGADGS